MILEQTIFYRSVFYIAFIEMQDALTHRQVDRDRVLWQWFNALYMIEQGRVCHQHLRSFSKFFFQENSQIIMKSIMSDESQTLVPFQAAIEESLACSQVS